MSNNTVDNDQIDMEEDDPEAVHATLEEAVHACEVIRHRKQHGSSWFLPVHNSCSSCAVITGGHPEMMAAYCPIVIDYLEREAEKAAEMEKKEKS